MKLGRFRALDGPRRAVAGPALAFDGDGLQRLRRLFLQGAVMVAVETAIGRWLRPEHELLVLCCTTRASADSAARLDALLRSPLDWDLAIRSANCQGVMPLVYRRLSTGLAERVAPAAIERLKREFNANLLRNRYLTRELVRLSALFQAAGISALAYKGPALAMAAYGDVAMRQFTDLDLVVCQADFGKAAEILRSQGYSQWSDPEALESGLFQESESDFTCVRGIVQIDLHWQLSPRYFAFVPEIEAVLERASTISLEGGSVLVPAPDDLMIALCVHASKHAWAALSMVCDVATLMEANPDIDWPAVVERAKRLRARRMVLLGFYLAHHLLGARIADEIVARAKADARVVSLARTIAGTLFAGHSDGEEQFPVLLVPLRAIERWRDQARFLLERAFAPSVADGRSLRLPRVLMPLHFFLRPLRLALIYARPAARRVAASILPRSESLR